MFTAGACPIGEDGTVVAIGDVVNQAEKVMANLQRALAAANASLEDVVKTSVYVATQNRVVFGASDLVALRDAVDS